MGRGVSRSHRTDRLDFSHEEDSRNQEEQVDSVSQKVHKVIDDIRSAINKANGGLLRQKLDELSDIFRIQSTETVSNHNRRILGILEGLQAHDEKYWRIPLQERDYYRNTEGKVIDTKDTPRLVTPTVELVMQEHFSHGELQLTSYLKKDPVNKREALVLRIYGIEIWKIPRILRGNK